jgi:alpha-1,2-mannosyltransferase
VLSQEQDQTLPQTPSRRKPVLHKIAWSLLAFALLNIVLSTALVRYLPPRDLRATAAAETIRFALKHAADDSWNPMLLALDQARDRGAESIYRSLFFRQKIKFQYPPSSLLTLDLLQSLSGHRLDADALNFISWLCVLALGALVPSIYLLVLRKFGPGLWTRFTRLDLGFQAVLVCLMTLSFYPVTRGFVLGQIQTWLTCLFAAAVLASLTGYEGLSGGLIGIVISVKPQLALLLAWGAIRGRRRFLTGATAVVLVLELLSLWRYGLTNQIDYLSVLSFLSAHGESFFANQSVNGILARLLHVGNNLEWDARSFPPYHPFVYYGTLISSSLMIALALFWGRKESGSRALLIQFVVAALVLTMASPIAWEHHYGILAPVYAVLFPMFLNDYPRRKWLVCLGIAYVATSNYFPFMNLAAHSPWNFVQSYLFAGAAFLTLTIYLHERHRRAVADPQPAAALVKPAALRHGPARVDILN